MKLRGSIPEEEVGEDSKILLVVDGDKVYWKRSQVGKSPPYPQIFRLSCLKRLYLRDPLIEFSVSL